MLGFLTTHRRYGLLLTGPVIVTSMVLVVIGASAAAAVTFPGVPSGVTAVATGPQAVKVTWNPSSGAQSYRVLRNAKLVAASVIGTTYTDAGLLPNTAYSYQVAACNSRGCSAKSAPVTATTPQLVLATPTGVTSAADPRAHVTVSWTPSAGATRYSVSRNGVALPSQPSFSKYVDWTTQPSSTYSYSVQGCNATACSTASVTTSVTTPAVVPPTQCSGVSLTPTAAIQSAINGHASGTTFCLSAGVYRISTEIVPKSRDVLWGVPGTLLTGNGVTATAIHGISTYQQGVTVRGISVERFTGDAMMLGNTWLVEDVEVANNGGIGLRLQDGATVRDSSFHDNGQYGLTGYAVSNVLTDGNEIAYNNTAHLTDGTAGGAKVLLSSSVTFSNNYIHDNFYNGLHCDGDCNNLTFDGNVIEGNTGVGLLYEKGFAAVIRNNLLAGNDALFAGQSLHFGGNLRLNTSQNVEVYGNTVEASVPGTNGISLGDYDRGTGSLGTYKLANDNVHDNFVRLLPGGQNGLVGSAHDPTHANNRFVANDYFVPAPSGSYFGWGVYPLTWSSWRGYGQDATGTLVQG